MHPAQRSVAFDTVRALLRRLRLAAPVVVAALVLAGCMQLKLDVHVNSDNTVSGTARIGVQKSLLEAVGGVDAFYKSWSRTAVPVAAPTHMSSRNVTTTASTSALCAPTQTSH